jgi:cysteine-rich repeat protein
MRTSVLATLLALSLVACAGTIDGGGGDDDVPENCGNGAVDTGETCDDSNTVDGDGCSATCTTEVAPRLTVTIDRPTVDTTLGKSEVVKATFVSEGGFTGNANVAVSVVDGANVAIPLLTAGGPTTVSIAANQSTTVDYAIGIPTNATGTLLTGTFKLDVTSSLEPLNLTSTVSITPTYTMVYEAGTAGDIAKHPIQAGKVSPTFNMKRGATIAYKNDDTNQHITHGGGVPHEGTTDGVDGQPGNTYSVSTLNVAPGTTITFGCHDHPGQNDVTYARITIE